MINRRSLLGWLSVSPVAGPSIAKAAVDSVSLPIAADPPKNIQEPIVRPRPNTITLSREQQEVAKICYPRRRGEKKQDWLRRACVTYGRNLIDLQMSGF